MQETPPNSNKTQEQLAQEYLEAYAKYEKIGRAVSSQMRTVDHLRESTHLRWEREQLPGEEEKLKTLLAQEMAAMDAYVAIGKLLTSETKDKYLRVVGYGVGFPPRKSVVTGETPASPIIRPNSAIVQDRPLSSTPIRRPGAFGRPAPLPPSAAPMGPVPSGSPLPPRVRSPRSPVSRGFEPLRNSYESGPEDVNTPGSSASPTVPEGSEETS